MKKSARGTEVPLRWDSAEFRDWMRQPTAWTILIVGVVLSLFAWRSLTLEVEYAARSSFNAVVAETRNTVDSRLRGYQTILYGLQGLFHAGSEVGRAAFNRYIESLAPARSAGHVRSFSYAQRSEVGPQVNQSPADGTAFSLAIRGQVEQETRSWVAEFQNNLVQLERDLQAKADEVKAKTQAS